MAITTSNSMRVKARLPSALRSRQPSFIVPRFSLTLFAGFTDY
jgi:hypothetical protein